MKVFILTLRLMLLYFGLQTISRLLWLISSYTQITSYDGTMSESYALQTWGIVGHLLFLGLLVVAWLMPRKFLGMLPSDVGNWSDDIQKLNDKLPQLVVFGIGVFCLFSSVILIGDYLFNWLINHGSNLNAMTFSSMHFWGLLWAAISLGIPLAMMFYSKSIARFFIK